MTYPSASYQECYRNNIHDYFACLTSDASITREEQRVHSPNANDFVFLPEQFASHYFRGNLVSGSYISMDPDEQEENDIEDDMNSDEDTYFENDANTQTMADNNCSVEEQQGAFFEQLAGQKIKQSNIYPLQK